MQPKSSKSRKPKQPGKDKSLKAKKDFKKQAEDGLDQHFFRRLDKLPAVRRFVIGWVVLFALLIGCTLFQINRLSGEYQTLKPVPGGIYNEGVLGTFTNANPLYATNEADTTISHLIFAGLFKYNDKNQLVGDLAQKWSVNKKGTIYTVRLKPGLVWQDGKPLTAKDVVFTYKTIQNPDTQSYLFDSWQGVTVKATGKRTVVFTLPDPLSSFPYNLTNGIVPEHLLANIPAASLRSADFNTKHPVGAGPFKWQGVDAADSTTNDARSQIALAPFDRYYAGQPKLSNMTVQVFASRQQLVSSFKDHELTSAAGLDSVPSDLAGDDSVQVHNMITSAATMVFFNNSSRPLNDKNVRQALVAAADPTSIIQKLSYSTRPVLEPFLEGQLGYNSRYTQASYNLAHAKAILKKDGWKVSKDGFRRKKKHRLTFDLAASTSNGEYTMIARTLKNQWRRLGVDVKLHLQNATDFQNTLSSRGYGAVVDSISIGVDPDVFVYWDGSQKDIASGGLNFSQYDSDTANTSLEAGRTRLDPALRAIKYRSFLKAWQKDVPALGLYQPRFLYITRGPVYGLDKHVVNSDSDRFNNVQNWEVNRARVTN